VKTVTQEEVTQEVGFGIIMTMRREGFIGLFIFKCSFCLSDIRRVTHSHCHLRYQLLLLLLELFYFFFLFITSTVTLYYSYSLIAHINNFYKGVAHGAFENDIVALRYVCMYVCMYVCRYVGM
jgi:hypothetical protein